MSGDDDFFIGWAGRLPRAHRTAVIARIVLAAALLLGLGLLLGHGLDDNGPAGFTPGGEVTRMGVVSLAPHPTLWVPPDADHPSGHTLLLAGDGKQGAAVANWGGRAVALVGLIIQRGDLEMLQVSEVQPQAGPPATPPVVSLGRWRIEGEICDGKCQAGAMQPGRGIAHRACAILCLSGQVPPVFVANYPVAGAEFLLLGNTDGGAGDLAWLRLVGLRVRLEGEVQRRGDLLVFLADLGKAEVVN